MSLLADIAAHAKDLPPQLRSLTVDQLIKFADICKEYVDSLAVEDDDAGISTPFARDQPRATLPLPNGSSLPDQLTQAISAHLSIDVHSVQLLWSSTHGVRGNESEDSSSHNLEPPTTTCLRKECLHRNLVDRREYSATLFTLKRGALKVTVASTYCKSCQTRYHPDFYVHAPATPNSTRVYYLGIPNALGVSDHTFFEISLCKLIENMYLFSHASSEGIARIYNRALADSTSGGAELKGPAVLDGFLLCALLRHHEKFGPALSVPHHEKNTRRFMAALTARNTFMAGTGQPQWAHACTGCMKIKTDADGRKYRQNACVVDGISITHACCGYKSPAGDPCHYPLDRTQDHFCPLHAEQRDICAINKCKNACELGFKTCSIAEHRALEQERLSSHGKSMFQLKERAAAAEQYLTTGKRTTRAPKRKGRKQKTTLTRTWTHNEELAVRCCGVIISRATFFQAEATTAVKDFIMATFPADRYPGCKPSFVFYDDNCSLWRFLLSLDSETRIRKFFADIGLPVDVFHFKSKHKETDLVCQTHCNPATYPDLMDDNGKWTYNSSAAEQANRWIKKFKSIVREMDSVRFNFFLDELIALRNEFIVEGLHQDGKLPHMVPDEELLNVEPVP